MVAGVGYACMVSFRWSQDIAEVNGQPWEPRFFAGARRIGQSRSVAKVGSDNLCVSFVNEEACAVEKFHQRASAGESTFREKDEATAFLKILGHVLDSVRGIHVDRKCAAVDHDAFVKPAQFGSFTRNRETP